MKRRLLLALILTGTLLSSYAHAQTTPWAIDPEHSSVNFQILHMAVSHVHGALGGIKGTVMLDEKDITKSSVVATIDVTTVSTGVAARDSHLKSPDFFDVGKSPVITFKSTSLVKAGDKLQLIGDLTIGGMTKSLTLDLDGPTPPVTMQGKTICGFSATGKLTRKEFDFGQKTAASAMIGDEVKFTVDVEIDRR